MVFMMAHGKTICQVIKCPDSKDMLGWVVAKKGASQQIETMATSELATCSRACGKNTMWKRVNDRFDMF